MWRFISFVQAAHHPDEIIVRRLTRWCFPRRPRVQLAAVHVTYSVNLNGGGGWRPPGCFSDTFRSGTERVRETAARLHDYLITQSRLQHPERNNWRLKVQFNVTTRRNLFKQRRRQQQWRLLQMLALVLKHKLSQIKFVFIQNKSTILKVSLDIGVVWTLLQAAEVDFSSRLCWQVSPLTFHGSSSCCCINCLSFLARFPMRCCLLYTLFLSVIICG